MSSGIAPRRRTGRVAGIGSAEVRTPDVGLARVRPAAMLLPMGSLNVALLEALLSAGVAPERARAVVELFDRSIDERYSLHSQILATKRDVVELETRLARDMAAMRTELSGDIASVKVEMAGMKTDLVKWFLGAMTAQTALLLGAAKLF
jgi:hypothetical protein